ncbi:MAG: membrane protein insertion efficiency factor YidD [bacterium]
MIWREGKILEEKGFLRRGNRKGSAVIANILILFIKVYQYTLSPIVGHTCRFIPTCSQYSVMAIKRHGPFTGMRLTIFRILKCHPWHKGGYDPVP